MFDFFTSKKFFLKIFSKIFSKKKFLAQKIEIFDPPKNEVKITKMAKFGQIVDFGQAYDPPPQFETKISKSQKLPILTPFWGILTLKAPKVGLKWPKWQNLTKLSILVKRMTHHSILRRKSRKVKNCPF